MSSLRNAVKRITHKERAQPKARSHLGFLEKKKDYTLRAQDYHRKEERINAMREKAAMRNPDEFYFGMHNAQVRDGQHSKTEKAKQQEFEQNVGTDTIRLMKDQDLRYIRMQKQRDSKKVERLKSSLHHLKDSNVARTHTIYVDSKDEAVNFDVLEHFETVPEMIDRAFNRPRVETIKKMALEASGLGNNDELTEGQLAKNKQHERKVLKKIAKAQAAAYKELEAREKRIATLSRAEAHLETERLVSSKGRKRKIKAAENAKPAQYKWRRRRLG